MHLFDIALTLPEADVANALDFDEDETTDFSYMLLADVD